MELNLCPAELRVQQCQGPCSRDSWHRGRGDAPGWILHPGPGRWEMQVGTRGEGMASWGQWNSRNPGWCQNKKTNAAPLKLLANLSIIPFLLLCSPPQSLWVGHCLSLHGKNIWCLYCSCHHYTQRLRTAIFKHWSEIKISKLETTANLE